MAFNIPSFEHIRSDILRDLQSLNPDADISSDSDYFVRASSIASCASGQYAHQAWIVRQIFPDTADTEFLELHCALRHIFRKDASSSTVTVTFTGTANTTIAAGTEIKASDADVLFSTLADVVCDASGIATATAVSDTKGVTANIVAQSGMCLSAPTGIDSNVTLTAGLGATNEETDGALLARLLNRLRQPPAGGNANDYKQWALSVEGVDNAYVYPIRRGLGTVDIAITANGGLPSAATILACQQYIDSVRPVTAKNAVVLAPSIQLVDIEYNAAFSDDEVTVKQRVQTAIVDYFNSLGPDDELVKSKLDAVISDTAGITDHVLITPSANVTNTTNQILWYKLGNLTVGTL